MIKVSINKVDTEIKEGLTANELLSSLGTSRAAIWINGRQLLRAEYGIRVITQGDEIKVLRITAGG